MIGEHSGLLVDGGSDAHYVPTGELVYARGNALFDVGLDADTLAVEDGPVSLVDGVLRTTSHANFDVSDDGTLFYVAGGVPLMSPLVWVDRDGSAEPIEAIPPNGYMTPRLSPHGDRVLVVAEGDAWVYDIASARESRITTDQKTLNDAGWTPDSQRVLFGSAREGTFQVFAKAADGTGSVERLTDEADYPVGITPLAVSPDRQHLLMQHGVTGETALLRMALEGDRVVEELLEGNANERNPLSRPTAVGSPTNPTSRGRMKSTCVHFPTWGRDGGRCGTPAAPSRCGAQTLTDGNCSTGPPRRVW